MIHFPCLITALCKTKGVPEKDTDQMCYPQVVFDKATVMNLQKPKGEEGKGEAYPMSLGNGFSSKNEDLLWDIFLQIQKDQ